MTISDVTDAGDGYVEFSFDRPFNEHATGEDATFQINIDEAGWINLVWDYISGGSSYAGIFVGLGWTQVEWRSLGSSTFIVAEDGGLTTVDDGQVDA